MSEPRKFSREEWLTNLREQWAASNTGLDFEGWQAKRLEEDREDAEARVLAQMAGERRERVLLRLKRQTPARYGDATTDEPALIAWASELARLDRVDELTGPSILIVGPTGTGKTHAMFGAVRHYVLGGGERGVTCVTMADLYAMLRPRSGVNSEEIFDSYAGCPLLAIDDLGAAKGSEWTDEINYRLLNHRYNAKLSTLVTSNVVPKDLATAIGDRVASRLAEMCDVVVLKGNDRRRQPVAAGENR